jgi:hypothetical protein
MRAIVLTSAGLLIALAAISTTDNARAETCDAKCRRDPCLTALYFEREHLRLMIRSFDTGMNPAFLQNGLKEAQQTRERACSRR